MREWSGFSFLMAILNDISSSQSAKAVRMGERVRRRAVTLAVCCCTFYFSAKCCTLHVALQVGSRWAPGGLFVDMWILLIKVNY